MRSHLIAYFCSEYSETDVSALHGVVKELSDERTWVSGPPEFVEHALVGMAFGLIENEDDLTEPLRFIDALSTFSKTHAIDFRFEVGDERIGTIENGIVEHTIQQGLINTWTFAAL